jgi:hypothetical protein
VTLRAVFHERDDAEAVAARLAADGFDAEAARERLAGEDDDEDHPWVVLTDAPEFVLELLVERHDGWLDSGSTVTQDAGPVDVSPKPPLELPTGPRRVKGHFRRG